jgi:sugar lactone lactonase YvrE
VKVSSRWCQCVLNHTPNPSVLPGPLYDPRTDTLHFVDILRKRVYNYHPGTKELVVHEYDEAVSALALRAEKPGVSFESRIHKGVVVL